MSNNIKPSPYYNVHRHILAYLERTRRMRRTKNVYQPMRARDHTLSFPYSQRLGLNPGSDPHGLDPDGSDPDAFCIFLHIDLLKMYKKSFIR